MNKRLLSIITVCKDDRLGLRATLSSIASQRDVSLHDFEVVVIDGASSDGSAVEALDFCAGLPVKLVSEADSGIYDAMNKGWRASSGQWVQFLNAGDRFADCLCLRDILMKLSSLDASDWLVARTAFLDCDGRVSRISRNVPYRFWSHALGLRMHAHPSTLMKRQLLCQLGGFQEVFGFAADFDIVLRAGCTSQPTNWHRLLVLFAPAGASGRHLLEVPEALHAIRVSSLELRGPIRLADRLFTVLFKKRWYREANRVHRTLGSREL
jgi:glycosyltransferase involved in cell wall biosynthesis